MLLSWMTRRELDTKGVVTTAVGQEEGPLRWLSLLGQRIRVLVLHARAAESAAAEALQQVQGRSQAMSEQVAAGQRLMDQQIEAAQSLRQQALDALNQTGDTLVGGLDDLRQTLDAKVAQVSAIVETLQRTGRELELLALNAAIQAAGAGEAGRAFGVVAAQVRELSKAAVANAAAARQGLDFQDLSDELARFRDRSQVSLTQTGGVSTDAFARIGEALVQARTTLDALDEHGRVIAALYRASQGTAQRQSRKLTWLNELGGDLVGADGGTTWQRILQSEQIPTEPRFDRLQSVRQRGVLRVAIEPTFKGLSFRMRPTEPLRGLDVEYATAFAKHLGVKIEFVEQPWDQCCELLHVGRRRGEAPVDLVWSALPPNQAWQGVAFSQPYTWLKYVLARRQGDRRIQGLPDLQGKVLGCISDPAAVATLHAAGLRWEGAPEPGTVRLANLVRFTDQSVIHDALASGEVDAFAVDQPIFAWACAGTDSPWRGRLEMLPHNLAPTLWHYAVGVADDPSSYHLLAEVNRFLAAFRGTPAQRDIEARWQLSPVQGEGDYRDEPGDLRGEEELAQAWAELA